MLLRYRSWSLRQLRYFVTVADELNFRRGSGTLDDRPTGAEPAEIQAARAAKSASRSSRAREPACRVDQRGRARPRLQARLTLRQAERTATVARLSSRGELGRLALGYIRQAPFSVVSQLIRRFRDQRPNVELALTELSTPDQLRALREGVLDAGISRGHAGTDGITELRLDSEPICVAVPSGHRLASNASIAVERQACSGRAVHRALALAGRGNLRQPDRDVRRERLLPADHPGDQRRAHPARPRRRPYGHLHHLGRRPRPADQRRALHPGPPRAADRLLLYPGVQHHAVADPALPRRGRAHGPAGLPKRLLREASRSNVAQLGTTRGVLAGTRAIFPRGKSLLGSRTLPPSMAPRPPHTPREPTSRRPELPSMRSAGNERYQYACPGILERAVRTIVELARPERVIVFGSQASGPAGSDSDLDILVVEDAIDKPRAESVRLRRALRDLPLSIDLIVCSLEDLQRWQGVPGSFLATVATSGTAVYRRE